MSSSSSIELDSLPSSPSAAVVNSEVFPDVTSTNSSQYNVDYALPPPPSAPLSATSTRGLIFEPEPENAVSLPPMDRGFQAWAYLAGAWAMELLVWSPPFSYGIFLDYYKQDPKFSQSSSSSLALVGSLATGLIYLTSPIILFFINRYPRQKRTATIIGIIVAVSGLIGAAFASKVSHLILTQGIMYSVGASLTYFPMSTYLFEWFSAKKGIANGIIYSGTGVGGVVTPFIVQALLDKYGQKTTLLSLAATFFILSFACLPLLKPRLPVAQVVGARTIDTTFLTYSPFWILFIANLAQGLGSFLPTLYLPTFATDLNLTTTSGTLAVAFLNGASVVGSLFLGWLSDLFDVRWSILISSVGSAIAVFFIWGFAEKLAPLLLFACIYGFLAPSWSALWPRFVATADGDDPRMASTLMGIFIAGRGVGNVLSAPIASGLLHPWLLTNKSNSTYGFEGYGPLIMFTGLALFASSMGIGYRVLERNRTSRAVNSD